MWFRTLSVFRHKWELYVCRVLSIVTSLGVWSAVKRISIDLKSQSLEMWSNAAVRSTNSRYSGCNFFWVICWTRFSVRIPSVVPQFCLNPFCSSDNWVSYNGLKRSRIIFIMSLQTVDPMLISRYFVGSDLDPLFFHKLFSLELPHALAMSRLFHRLSVIRWMTWFIMGWLQALRISGAISLLALLFFKTFSWCSISSIVGGWIVDMYISWNILKFFKK